MVVVLRWISAFWIWFLIAGIIWFGELTLVHVLGCWVVASWSGLAWLGLAWRGVAWLGLDLQWHLAVSVMRLGGVECAECGGIDRWHKAMERHHDSNMFVWVHRSRDREQVTQATAKPNPGTHTCQTMPIFPDYHAINSQQ